ncbi:hypothetical protein MJO28_000669 [Puccinia striiformis f. sp. tritici]|uniref:Uncharacterized protein n=1 Tax=Puccinia striiformis f. sp. tritici TaxID=168172 RepID=A0ACC0F099_9BASI|nr:hypothetical protein MJO28_000669 [Puccinia striiformis f. sp. tritici]
MLDSAGKPSYMSEHQRHWHLGNLVTYGFERLETKCDLKRNEPSDPMSIDHVFPALSVDDLEKQENLLNQLHSKILPALKSQITSLLLALDPPSILKDPEQKLHLILKTQGELHYSLDQLEAAIDIVCPEPTIISNRNDDHHRRGLKSYRLHQLRARDKVLSSILPEMFEIASELIQQMRLTSGKPVDDYDINFFKNRLDICILPATDWIQSTIDRLKASDFDMVKYHWKLDIINMGSLLEDIIRNLDPSTAENRERPQKYVRDPVIQLAKLVIPIFKLSRIFFKKLSKRGLNNERLPVFTEMCSNQIECLVKCAAEVSDDLLQLTVHLDFANRDRGVVTSLEFIELATTLKARFESPLLLVVLYIIPFIPDNESLNVQNYHRNWCLTWNNQMSLAIHNFECAAKSLNSNL